MKKKQNLKISIFCFIAIFFISCGSRKNSTISKKTKQRNTTNHQPIQENIVHKNFERSNRVLYAETFLATPYKMGGNSKQGMDCSGFIGEVFRYDEINLPRRSEDQSKAGKAINQSEIKMNDLLFFSTSGSSRISHVGMVYFVENEKIYFIHASSSKGVTISDLDEKYWRNAYRFARRID